MAYSYSDITFLENPFSFSVTLKSQPERKKTASTCVCGADGGYIASSMRFVLHRRRITLGSATLLPRLTRGTREDILDLLSRHDV